MSFSHGLINRVRRRSELSTADRICDLFSRLEQEGHAPRPAIPDPWTQWVAELGVREGRHLRAAAAGAAA